MSYPPLTAWAPFKSGFDPGDFVLVLDHPGVVIETDGNHMMHVYGWTPERGVWQGWFPFIDVVHDISASERRVAA